LWSDYGNPYVDSTEALRTIFYEKTIVERTYPALTAAELGEMLAPVIEADSIPKPHITGFDKTIECYTYLEDGAENEAEIIADTEADARAKMLIYLIENGLLKP